MTKTDTSREAVSEAAKAITVYPHRGPYTADLLRALLTERDALQARAERAEAGLTELEQNANDEARHAHRDLIQQLTERAERAEEGLKAWIELASHCSIEEGVCCCGDDMENHSHPMDCGHSPVDHGSYIADQLVEDTRATLAQLDAEPAGVSDQTHREGWEQAKEAAAGICLEYSKDHGSGMFDKHSDECEKRIRAMPYPGDSQ